MSGLILPAWLSTQPQYAAVIDSKNPLCNGLRYVVSGAEPSINLVDRKAKASTTGSGLVMASGPSGKKVTAGASNGAHAWNGINAGSKFTVAMVARDTVTGVYRMPFAVLDGGANNVFFLRYGNPNDVEFRVYDNVGNDSAFISVGTVSSTQTSVIVGTVDAGRALSLYYNGRLQSSVAAAAVTANPMLATQNVRLGSNNGEDFGGEIYLALIWARTLSANEVKAFSLNPWQVLKAPTRRLWFGAGASGGSATVAGFTGVAGATTGKKSQSATAAGIGGGAESATGKKSQSTTALGIAGQGGTATARKAQSATVLSFTGTGGAFAGRKAQATTWLGTGGGVCVVSALHGGKTSVLGIAGAGGLISTVLNRSTTITGFAAGAGSATGKHGGAVTILGALGGAGTNAARHAGNTTATGAAGTWSAFIGRKSQSTTYTVKAGGGGTITAVAGSVVEYSRAPSGMGSPLIYAGTERPAVISGNRPGNINTSRPANRGGRRT